MTSAHGKIVFLFLECCFLSVFVVLERGFCKTILFLLALYVFVFRESVLQEDMASLSLIRLCCLSERVLLEDIVQQGYASRSLPPSPLVTRFPKNSVPQSLIKSILFLYYLEYLARAYPVLDIPLTK